VTDNTEVQRARRRRLREQGLCTRCGKEPSVGRRCDACRQQENAAALRRYYRLRADGMCTQCGRRSAGGSACCEVCAPKMAERQRRRRKDAEP